MDNHVYLLNGLEGNSLLNGVYSNVDNLMLKFGSGGTFRGEAPLSYKYARLREIDMISILNVNNQLEVAYVINQQFKKFPIYADIYELITWCRLRPSLIFIGRRSDTFSDYQGSVEYTQYLFGFTKGAIKEDAVKEGLHVNG